KLAWLDWLPHTVFSRRMTDSFDLRAMSRAVAAPIMPPPTMMTSASSMNRLLPLAMDGDRLDRRLRAYAAHGAAIDAKHAGHHFRRRKLAIPALATSHAAAGHRLGAI